MEDDFYYLVGCQLRRWGTRADVDTALEYFQDMVNFSHDVLKTMSNRETAVKFLSNPEQYWVGVENWINTMANRSEEHTSEIQSLMRISYAVFCMKQKT